MINLDDLITEERGPQPPRIILYGPHKIGKSTFGASAPAPIFIPTEDGLTTIKCPAFPVSKNLDEFYKYIGLLIEQEHEYKTVIIDTLDWLEKLIWAKVCTDKQVKSLEDIGYGKGYLFAMAEWEKFIKGLEKLKQKGMAVILLAHSEIKTFTPPDNQSYDRWQIKLHKTAAAKCEEWVDAILFANYKTYVSKNGLKGKATGGVRTIYTTPDPAFMAGNRYSLPEEMEMDFNVLINEIKKTN